MKHEALVSLSGYRFTTGDLEACSPTPLSLIFMPLRSHCLSCVGHSAEEKKSLKDLALATICWSSALAYSYWPELSLRLHPGESWKVLAFPVEGDKLDIGGQQEAVRVKKKAVADPIHYVLEIKQTQQLGKVATTFDFRIR